jgi:serine/threonine-protein kinase
MIDRLNAALEGRYRLLEQIGEGGMATVFLADDLKHNRKVALKVLKPELAAVVGADRFLAEIETTANLQHPHILPLFDSGEADGFLFFVMPYIDGETLGEKLQREKQLPVDEAVGIATAMAAALSVAHEQGVIHRDIKPGNVLLSRGEPLVSDFGIAIAVTSSSGARLTETGLSVGTPYYMSPEQATGDREVTAASDVYSLGCVLYEMLVGEPPYVGTTAQAVLGKILTEKPRDPSKVRAVVPPHVEGAVMKALEKLPADRFTTASGFVRALKDPGFRYGVTARATGDSGGGRWKVGALTAIGVAAISLASAAWMGLRSPEPPPTMRSVFTTLPGQGIVDRIHHIASFAPDGSLLVYQGPGPNGPQLWMKERDQLSARPLEGTLGAQHPEVDPTGRWVAFTVGQELRKMPLYGGPSVVLADSTMADVGGIAWLDDGWIVYTAGAFEPRRVPAVGGTAQVAPVPFEVGQQGTLNYNPLPGGGLLYTLCSNFCRGQADLWAWDSGTGNATELVQGVLAGWYLDSGHLVFLRPSGSVFAVEFDPRTLELGGEPIPLFEGVRIGTGLIPDMEVGPSGQLLVHVGGAQGTNQELVWIRRDGSRTQVDPAFSYQLGTFPGVRLSPDDRKAAFARTTDSGTDIWVKELDAGPVYRLTFDDAPEYRPEWSADGETLMFVSERGGNRDLYRRRANATGPVEVVLDQDVEISQGVWSADGEWLLFRQGTGDGRDIWAVQTAGDAEPFPLVATAGYDEKAPALSPDGQWLAYESDETGQEEIYVRPFPNVEDGKWQVSVSGGTEPVWGPDGREVFYVRGDNMLIATAVHPGPPFRVDTRSELFSVAALALPNASDHASYDVSGDGQRFLFTAGVTLADGEDNYWLMVENWGTELTRLLGDRR